jgi:hypothetical protein
MTSPYKSGRPKEYDVHRGEFPKKGSRGEYRIVERTVKNGKS